MFRFRKFRPYAVRVKPVTYWNDAMNEKARANGWWIQFGEPLSDGYPTWTAYSPRGPVGAHVFLKMLVNTKKNNPLCALAWRAVMANFGWRS